MSEEPEELHVTPETLDFSAVAKVATRVKLKDVRLIWSCVGRFVDLSEIDPDWGDEAFMGFDSHSDAMERDGDEAVFAVHCSFVCRSDAENGADGDLHKTNSEEPPDVDIQAVFELIYDLRDPEGIDRADLEHFAFVNGTHNAWPYWREYAHATTMRLGVPPYIVPPFKLPSVHDPDAPVPREDAK